jgi:hypothetical protein
MQVTSKPLSSDPIVSDFRIWAGRKEGRPKEPGKKVTG